MKILHVPMNEDLFNRIEHTCQEQPVPVSKAALVRKAIEEKLVKLEARV